MKKETEKNNADNKESVIIEQNAGTDATAAKIGAVGRTSVSSGWFAALHQNKLHDRALAGLIGHAWPCFTQLYRRLINPSLFDLAYFYYRDNGEELKRSLTDGTFQPACTGFTPGLLDKVELSDESAVDEAVKNIICLYVQLCMGSALSRHLSYRIPGCYNYTATPLRFADDQKYWITVDLHRYFAGAEHGLLLDAVAQQTGNMKFTAVVERYLQLGLLENGIARRHYGKPYGSPLAPEVANILLYPLLAAMVARKHGGCIRIDDTLLIPMHNIKQAFRVLKSLTKFIKARIATGNAKDITAVINARSGGSEIIRGFIRQPVVSELVVPAVASQSGAPVQFPSASETPEMHDSLMDENYDAAALLADFEDGGCESEILAGMSSSGKKHGIYEEQNC